MGLIGGFRAESYTVTIMNTSIIAAAAALTLFAVSAQAQFVTPVRVTVPILRTPVLGVPAPMSVLPRPDVYTLPVPSLPGLPVYRYAVPVAVAAQPAPVAVALPGVALPLAAGQSTLSGRVRVEGEASRIQASAPTKTIDGARKGFGLDGKKPDANRLQSIFDGSLGDASNETVVLVEEVDAPQTLPEVDLLREIGVGPLR